jgi:hypothetical protein
VTYLLGADDDDPNGPDIDKACAAEAQGPTRLRRGVNYFKYLESRHSTGLEHRVFLVPGVAHNARKMFTSTCGIDALFETGACTPARVTEERHPPSWSSRRIHLPRGVSEAVRGAVQMPG